MFEVLWDLLFPKRCLGCRKFGEYLCTDCFSNIHFAQSYFCGICASPSYNGLTHPRCQGKYTIDGIFPVLNYKGILKKVLYQYKYNPNLSDLTTILADLLYEGFIQNEILMKSIETDRSIITSVPLHSARQKKRGYNQSDLLAKNVAKKLNKEYSSKIIIRVVNTEPQYKLPKAERALNVKNAFMVIDKDTIKNKTVFIIDDITTTGATLSECANVLKRVGVRKIFGVALGHEEK